MKKLILSLILVVVFLVGCDSGNTGPTMNTFIGGTDALSFDFMEETPPLEVYDNGQQPFEVTVNIENKGEYDVPKEDVKIKLTGFYLGDFNNPITQLNPEEDLARSYIDPDGEKQRGTITYVNFDGFNFMGSLAGNNRYTIRADVCYKYGTKAQADLCILEDLTPKSDEQPVCNVDGTKYVASSSAPVQVENFREEVSGTRKVKFTFDVVHRGNGLVSKLGSDCSTELMIKNKVWVEVDSGLPGLSCSGLTDGTDTTGYITLYGSVDQRKVTCNQDISEESGDFEKKINVLLRYDYKEHKERVILVKHITN
jgi:hypothetical protein